jgi:hypothetical protein
VLEPFKEGSEPTLEEGAAKKPVEVQDLFMQ